MKILLRSSKNRKPELRIRETNLLLIRPDPDPIWAFLWPLSKSIQKLRKVNHFQFCIKFFFSIFYCIFDKTERIRIRIQEANELGVHRIRDTGPAYIFVGNDTGYAAC
jgi:hypothetical protein